MHYNKSGTGSHIQEMAISYCKNTRRGAQLAAYPDNIISDYTPTLKQAMPQPVKNEQVLYRPVMVDVPPPSMTK